VRRWFWPLVALGTLLQALAAASLAFAFANRNYAEAEANAGWTNYVPLIDEAGGASVGFSFDENPCFTCVDPLPWFVVGIILAVIGLVPFVIAARHR
jgi:hypothetical protein